MKLECISEAVGKFHGKVKENHRYLSWEHCYRVFHDARKQSEHTKAEIDTLCLHLAFYLASWGMYRGSSFLLQRDYKVHVPIVKEILNRDYDVLLGLKCKDFLDKAEIRERLKKLNQHLDKRYSEIRASVVEEKHQASIDAQANKEKSISTVLITKVLLGTLACTPAYDRFFVDAVRKYNVTTGNYNNDSLKKLAEFYQNHSEIFKKYETLTLQNSNLCYPQMKLLDMAFWQIGGDDRV
ncbi:hypothetical protein HKX40_05220 [Pelistega europaea]|uniref:Uncharacterized protein n=1 Tax=Pelistega europaea TaxID=106147 RepID=A0A7Y4L9K5_9BURK|nr:hypothetical protein [Pelistega europaea]